MSEPDRRPTDRAAKQLRSRALDLAAEVSVAVERLDAIAKQAGITPELVDGLGDQLYEAAVAQLELVSKVLERSQGLADRLISLGERRCEVPRFARVEVRAGEVARHAIEVNNPSGQAATVAVTVEPADCGASVQIGQPALPGRRDTIVEVSLATQRRTASTVIPLVVRIQLVYESQRRVELPIRELEIWVRA